MSGACQFATLALSEGERAAFLERVRPRVGADDYRLIEGMSYALPELIEWIEQDPMTLRKLRHLLFGPKTEKTDQVCPATAPPAPATPVAPSRAQGHGRTQARHYTGARWVSVRHPQLQAGARCPRCSQGTVRAQKTPAILLRIVGAPPISATGYTMERLRGDACGEVFTAPTPPEAGQEKCAERGGDRGVVALRQRDAALPLGQAPAKPGGCRCPPRPSGSSCSRWLNRPSRSGRS